MSKSPCSTRHPGLGAIVAALLIIVLPGLAYAQTPEVDGLLFVGARGLGFVPQITDTATLSTTPSSVGPIVADLSGQAPVTGRAGGGAVQSINIEAGSLRVASCAAAETGTGEGFIGDGSSRVEYRETFDVLSATLAAGTVVTLTFEYGAVQQSHATHSFGNIIAAHHSRSSANVQVRLLSNAPTQRSYAINDQFNRFSYNSENPDANGVWALPVPIVSVPINARVGHTISLELTLASEAVSDVRFVDNDGNTSVSASLAWSFEGPGDVILISHLVGGEPPEIGAVTPTSLESSVLPFPDPFAPVVGPGVPVTGPIGSVVLAFALLTGGGLHLMRTARRQ